jgi:hypothetical protein
VRLARNEHTHSLRRHNAPAASVGPRRACGAWVVQERERQACEATASITDMRLGIRAYR